MQQASGPDTRACLSLELTSTSVRSGAGVSGTLVVVNRSGDALTYTQPDGCATTVATWQQEHELPYEGVHHDLACRDDDLRRR